MDEANNMLRSSDFSSVSRTKESKKHPFETNFPLTMPHQLIREWTCLGARAPSVSMKLRRLMATQYIDPGQLHSVLPPDNLPRPKMANSRNLTLGLICATYQASSQHSTVCANEVVSTCVACVRH
mmetsp:Transcript_15522/g.17546  ORF Transcript_15522/g.17546 Transcript_15522/m.17546 type:complete len:125 (-) Transcript_15522:186-560(-)